MAMNKNHLEGFCGRSGKHTTMKKGYFIVIEGADGCGKSTHAKLLGKYLKEKGYEVVVTREPTRGPIGLAIRDILAGRAKASPSALALFFTADRADHVDTVIKPALEEGKVVISDRYYYSTVAYQSVQGVKTTWISQLNSFVPEPDLVVVLKIESEEALARMSGRQLEVFEVLNFQKKVQEALLNLAYGARSKLSKPGKVWKIISTATPIEQTQEKIRDVVGKYLK